MADSVSFSTVQHNTPSKYTKYSFGRIACPAKKSFAVISLFFNCEPPRGSYMGNWWRRGKRCYLSIFRLRASAGKLYGKLVKAWKNPTLTNLQSFFASLLAGLDRFEYLLPLPFCCVIASRECGVAKESHIFREKCYEIFLQFEAEPYISAAV